MSEDMLETSWDRIKYIFLNMIADTRFAAQALSIISEDMLDTESEYPCRLILRAIKYLIEGGQEDITTPSISVAVGSVWESDNAFTKDDLNEATRIACFIADAAKDCKPDLRHANKELRTFVQTRGVLEGTLGGIAGVEAEKAIQMIRDAYEKLNAVNAVTSGSKSDDDYFDPAVVANIKRNVMVPTGVPVFDSMLGGGPCEGDSIGIIGFPSGGKTLLGVQLVCETAQSRKHAAYFMYENDPEDGGLNTRCKGYAAGIPASVFHEAVKTDQDISPEYQQRIIKEASKWMHEYLHVQNCAGPGLGIDGMDTVRNYLARMEREGKHISLLVIDQLLPMVVKYMNSNGIKDGDRRQVFQQFMLELTAIADEYKTVAVMLHQIDNVSKKLPTTRRPMQGMASEDKSFDNWIIHSFVLGKKDINNRSYFSLVKSRRRDEQHLVVQHKPDLWRVDYDDGVRFEVDQGNDAFVTAADNLNT